MGSELQLVADVPVGGAGGFYEVIQNDTASSRYRTYPFYQGYNAMSFSADKTGRYMLYFVVNNQPSNVVIVDAFAPAPSAQDLLPSSNSQAIAPPAQFQTPPTTAAMPTASPPSPAAAVGGDTPVTIQSQELRGYQVFLDETYIGTEGDSGDAPDGVFSFKVLGGQNHNLRVYDGQFNYPRTIYFARGVLKIINVEPGMAVHI